MDLLNAGNTLCQNQTETLGRQPVRGAPRRLTIGCQAMSLRQMLDPARMMVDLART